MAADRMIGAGEAIVVGAGPAGLAAARELAVHGVPTRVFEKDDQVGGISRTVEYRGYRFDIGGHRFFTKLPEVQRLWEETLGDDFLERPRLSRIYYRGRFFDYPLRPVNALIGLGPIESARIMISYAQTRFFPLPEERNFEQWVVNRFGRRLYEVFFRTYTEKVWGMPCTEIAADWAAQRIKNLDLKAAVVNAILAGRKGRGGVITTLIDRFHYPRLGPGMMWERWADGLADRGVETELGARVVRLHRDDGAVRAVTVRRRGGIEERVDAAHVVSSMPLGELVRALDPPAPPAIREAADRLRHRDFLTVVLIVEEPDVFPDNWIYIHAPEVSVGRIQNFKNWSPDMVPDPSTTSLGLEYFVHRGDETWTMSDDALVDLGRREVTRLGLVDEAKITDGTVIRMPKAYPVYDAGYRQAVATIRRYLDGFANLHSVGRNGQHRYNNQDHSMMTGILAARNAVGAEEDVWEVNVEPEYHEAEAVRRPTGRWVPAPAAGRTIGEVLSAAFARYDPIALGTAVATVASGTLLVASVAFLLENGGTAGPPLSLLGQYLFGYEVSWTGAAIGTVQAAGMGFGFGWIVAKAINALVGWHERVLLAELEVIGTLDPLAGERG